jgi:3-methyladenine DNA glycosylase AlkD
VTVNRELIGAVRGLLAERADSARAPGMQAYMKSSMPYRGVTSPVLRLICREVFGQFVLATEHEWQATALALWHEAAFREERYAALALVGARQYAPFRTLAALPLFERLIVAGAWWDLVDGLATHEVGDLVRRYPSDMRPIVLAWSIGPDPWLRRSAIICQVGFKQQTDQALLYACIEPNLAARGFFLRKAIGWALREYAKAAPDQVRHYVAAHETQLSPLSRREALKHLH